jgi:hypothetical protein
VRPGWTDMRKQVDGLAALVRDGLGRDPLEGSLYLFCGMGGRRLKALYWNRNGSASGCSGWKRAGSLAEAGRGSPEHHQRPAGPTVGRHRLLARPSASGVPICLENPLKRIYTQIPFG